MSQPIALAACTVDLDRLEVHRSGEVVRLSPTERDLLAHFVAHPEEVLSRRDLLTDVWGYASSVRSRTPDVTIRRLRMKIERDPGAPDHLVTVRGGGWEWRPAPDETPSIGLPSVVDVFVGREAELAEVQRHCESGALVSLVGPPGSGRTRLAHEVVRRSGGRVLWIDAAELVDVPGALTAALVGEASGPVSAAEVAHACAVDWLVLDGLAEVSDTLRGVLGALLEHADDTSLLATTSRAIGLPGERVYPVPPLSAGDARALWDARTRGTRASDEGLEELLDLLDGHPLALELAAGRVGVLGPTRLAERLSKRIDVLQDRTLGASLAAPLEAAWEVLEPWARTALVRLAPTRGGFDLDAAESLIGTLDGIWALDALDDLVRWSWLRAGTGPDGAPRLSLPPILALFAEQQASSTERAEAGLAHARHYAERCAAAYDPELRRLRQQAARLLLAELPNLRAAWSSAREHPELRWGLVLGLTGLSQRTPVPELDERLSDALKLESDRTRQDELHLFRVEHVMFTGAIDEAGELLDQRSPASQPQDAVARVVRATIAHAHGDRIESERLALSVVDDPQAPADARLRAWVLLDTWGFPGAIPRALEVLRPLDAPHIQGALIDQQAIRALFRGEVLRASELVEEAWALHRSVAHPYTQAFNRLLSIEIDLALGREAADMDPLLETFERLGRSVQLVHYQATQARVALLQGRVAEGRSVAEDALDRAVRRRATGEWVRCREVAAEAAWLDGDRAAARVHLELAGPQAPVHSTVHAFLALADGSEAVGEPPGGPEGRHGEMRWRILAARARGQDPPEPSFPELVSVRVARLLTR